MKNDTSKLRWDKKKQIINSLEQLEKNFDEYFKLWKKVVAEQLDILLEVLLNVCMSFESLQRPVQ